MNANCKDYQHQITLFLYDELADEGRRDLESHLQECQACKQVFDGERGMHSVLADDVASWDVPPDLLVESRRALADELDRLETKRSWWRMPAFSVVFTPMRLLESTALIAMGLALGVYVTNQRTPVVPTATAVVAPASGIPQDGTISNLQVVNADPATGRVELAGEVSQPVRFNGGVEDDLVRQLLFNALRDSRNPGSRLKAVEVLSQKPTDESIEEALIGALIYDNDAGVRMRALEGLKTFANE
jgi:anti-sigma factor RsiW